MSYTVTIAAKTPEELSEKIQALLSRGIFSVSSAPTNAPDPDDEDTLEEVESPFKGQAPSLNTVVDNEVDSYGIPWDSRIHTVKKTQCKDGSWKLAKGVDKDLVTAVKAELRARVGAQAPVAAAPAPIAPAPQMQAPVQTPAAQPALPSAAPALPQMQSGHTLESFKNQFAMIIANLITQGKLTQDYVNTLKAHFGVAEIWQASDDQKAACFNEFVNCGLVQKVG